MRLGKIFGTIILLLSTICLPVHAATYDDIDPDYWYAPYVEQAGEEGIMTGVSENQFSPYSQMNRAMAAVVFYRLSGSPAINYVPTYPDVPADTYYSQATTWARQSGIITGYANGNFGPSDPLTREQMMLMAFRYKAQKDGVSWRVVDTSSYDDYASVSDYAKDAMTWGLYYNIICSIQNHLHPQQAVTRAESCRLLMLAEHIQNGQDPNTIAKIPDDPNHCSHINVELQMVKAPDCTHGGINNVMCMDCQKVLQQVKSASAHTMEWQTIQAPSLFAKGLEVYQCKYCGYIEQQREIEYVAPANPSLPQASPDLDGALPGSGEQTIYVDTGYGNATPVTGHYDSLRAKEIFNLTNDYRARAGLAPYQWGDLTADKVNIRAAEVSVYVAHMRPNGQHALQYYMQDGGIENCRENIAYNMRDASSQDIMDTWMDGGSHEEAIFSTQQTHLAVGVFVTNDASYFVQCFYS